MRGSSNSTLGVKEMKKKTKLITGDKELDSVIIRHVNQWGSISGAEIMQYKEALASIRIERNK